MVDNGKPIIRGAPPAAVVNIDEDAEVEAADNVNVGGAGRARAALEWLLGERTTLTIILPRFFAK